MASILYVVKYPLEDVYTIKNKVDGQLSSLVGMGWNVFYIAYDHKNIYLVNANENRKEKIGKTNIKNDKSAQMYLHIKAFWDLFKYAHQTVTKIKMDVVYIRNCPFDNRAVKLCEYLHSTGTKTVIEIPTYPIDREKIKSPLRKIYWKYTESCVSKIEKNLDLYAIIGEQASEYHGIKTVNIENCVDVNLFKIREKIEHTLPYHLIAVASMANWHGYDRIINGLANASPDVKAKIVFDVVGSGGDGSLDKWKELVEKNALQNIVIFHGTKLGEELNQLFDIADCGIASLGMYRTGFSSGSVLKLREYTARGIPFVYAHNDPGISSDCRFALKIPNDDSPVNIEEVVSFIDRIYMEGIVPSVIREYAVENMTWDAQFEKVFNQLNL